MVSPHDRLQAARRAIELATVGVDKTLAFLKREATVDGRISTAKLDRHQVACYETALNASELGAATAMLDYAQGKNESRLEGTLALLFTADVIANVRGRTLSKTACFGLDAGDLAQSVDAVELVEFVNAELSIEHLENTAAALVERNGSTGDYGLSDDHEMMRSTFRQFATDVVMPLAEEIHRHDLLIPDQILDQLTELGCFGLSIPEQYGGFHEDDIGMIVVTEELSRGSLGAAGSLITRPEILARALMAGGTEQQKEYWLPKLAEGDPLCAVAVTEPDYGSDVAAMKFKATKTDGGWLLSGAKTWCTFGGKAGVLLVLARTNPDPASRHKGLSIFLAEKPVYEGHDFEVTQESGGTLTGRAIATIGYRGMHSYECFFDDYFVPDTALLGGEAGLGKGFYYIMAGFSGGRIQTAARACGVMQAAFEQAYKYSFERKVFGTLIGDYQLTAIKLARMAALMCATRQYTYAVGRLMDQGGGQTEASMVKLFAGRSAEWLTREAMQIHGGMGYAEETAVSRYFLDARVLSIFEGAEEVLALRVIARSLVQNHDT